MPRCSRSQHRLTNALDRKVFFPTETTAGTGTISLVDHPDTGYEQQKALRLSMELDDDSAQLKYALVRRDHDDHTATSSFEELFWYGKIALGGTVVAGTRHIFFKGFSGGTEKFYLARNSDNTLRVAGTGLPTEDSVLTLPVDEVFEIRLTALRAAQIGTGQILVDVRTQETGAWVSYVVNQNITLTGYLTHYAWHVSQLGAPGEGDYPYRTYILDEHTSEEAYPDDDLPWHYQVRTLSPDRQTATIAVPVGPSTWRHCTYARVRYMPVDGDPQSEEVLTTHTALKAASTVQAPGAYLALTDLIPGRAYQYTVELGQLETVPVALGTAPPLGIQQFVAYQTSQTYYFRTLSPTTRDVREVFHLAGGMDSYSGPQLGLQEFAALVDSGLTPVVSFQLGTWGTYEEISHYTLWGADAPDDFLGFGALQGALERDPYVIEYFQRVGIYFLRDDHPLAGCNTTWDGSSTLLNTVHAKWTNSSRTQNQAYDDWALWYKQTVRDHLPNKASSNVQYGYVASGRHEFVYLDTRFQRTATEILGTTQTTFVRSRITDSPAKTLFLLSQQPLGLIASQTDSPYDYDTTEMQSLVDYITAEREAYVVHLLSGGTRVGYLIHKRWDGSSGVPVDERLGLQVVCDPWGQSLAGNNFETGSGAAEYAAAANVPYLQNYHSETDGPDFGETNGGGDEAGDLLRGSGMFLQLDDFSADLRITLGYQESDLQLDDLLFRNGPPRKYNYYPARSTPYPKLITKIDSRTVSTGVGTGGPIVDPDPGGGGGGGGPGPDPVEPNISPVTNYGIGYFPIQYELVAPAITGGYITGRGVTINNPPTGTYVGAATMITYTGDYVADQPVMSLNGSRFYLTQFCLFGRSYYSTSPKAAIGLLIKPPPVAIAPANHTLDQLMISDCGVGLQMGTTDTDDGVGGLRGSFLNIQKSEVGIKFVGRGADVLHLQKVRFSQNGPSGNGANILWNGGGMLLVDYYFDGWGKSSHLVIDDDNPEASRPGASNGTAFFRYFNVDRASPEGGPVNTQTLIDMRVAVPVNIVVEWMRHNGEYFSQDKRMIIARGNSRITLEHCRTLQKHSLIGYASGGASPVFVLRNCLFSGISVLADAFHPSSSHTLVDGGGNMGWSQA